MKITSSEYIISAVGPGQYPEDGLPEIALAGRSNVGKSSLINKLINRKNLARTSGQPGKTRALNYYLINQEFYFVDLPGYGFAKVSKEIRNEWAKFIERYLEKREVLKGVIHIIDIRHEPSKEDLMMHDWLLHLGIEVLTVITKADKLSRNQQGNMVKKVKQGLKLGTSERYAVFSSETGQGKEDVLAWVEEMCQGEKG